MQPVGLAPNETKKVRYYVYVDWPGTLKGMPVAEGSDSDSTSELRDADDTFGNKKEVTLANVELCDFEALEATSVYVPASEWGSDAVLTKEFEDGKSKGSNSTYTTFISGSVTNNIDDRWKSAEAQFDFTMNDQVLDLSDLRSIYYL